MTFGQRVAAYAAHPDPMAAACNRIALLVASSQPTYPLYLWWLVGGPWWLACWTFMSTPVFCLVPWAARRNPILGPALLVLAGFGNGLVAAKALGAGSGVELFLVPEALIALLTLRGSPWLKRALLAGAVLTFWLGRHLGSPLGQFAPGQTAQMARINAGSALVLTLVVLWSLGGLALHAARTEHASVGRRLLRATGLAGWLLALALAVLVLIGLDNVLADPIERTASVNLPMLPAGTLPLHVALLSDIHLGNRGMRPERLDRIVAQINAARPDLIVIAGDFITGYDDKGAVERAAGLTAPLSRLRAPLGVVAVLGNHDHWTVPQSIRAGLARAGVVVLENVAVRRGPFTIVGVDDLVTRHDDVPRAMAEADRLGGIPIALSHSPDIVKDLPDRVPLLLAGHTHCGQVVLPWGTSVASYVSSKRLFDPRYRCGRIDDPHRTTFVTAGVGSGTVPVRLGAMTDWWLVEVRR
jgi:predicted MPP superfamily phosphohydrolase